MLKTKKRKPSAFRNGDQWIKGPKIVPSPRPQLTLIPVIEEVRALQRKRSIVIKSRIMQANRIQMIMAGTLGYSTDMKEKERAQKMKESSELIKEIAKNNDTFHEYSQVVKAHLLGINAFNEMKDSLDKLMLLEAKKLPAAKWVELPEQRGFGLLFLAIVIGETGDLSNYSNPGKVWRRLGCAPWTFENKVKMGCTWKSGREGKLPSEQWEKFGYSPRRRSIAYLIGEGIVKQNGPQEAREEQMIKGKLFPARKQRGSGPYHNRYVEAKEKAHENHTNWSDLRCHRHAMLLATKLLLKNLWIVWNS